MTEKRVLPADVYDALELSALAFGGIGGGEFFDWDYAAQKRTGPCCVFGHAEWLDKDGHVAGALSDAGVTIDLNDNIVPFGKRLTWKQYCRKLNIVRAA